MCNHEELDVQDIPPEIHQVHRLAAGSKLSGDLGGMSLS